ncbi:MAG: hypothetical protein A3F12_00130 [Gammaproteobacteria bacterium RIFCSPHIGHO2_12_FULL_38_14]|nr:MAG: hypothetical protein A3F12_00130 [Gammaproteobacteria bacterium RIFCSPHIGHO2_12_FULL_38_14]
MRYFLFSCFLFLLTLSSSIFADGLWYFSWGYSKDYWTDSDIHISQPSLNNDFTVQMVKASDDPGWNTGLFNKSLMSPQYNFRLGRFFDKAHTWGLEINFDHTKYNNYPYQYAYVSGTINGVSSSSTQVLTPTYFKYFLHNGFNSLMINGVRRKPLFTIPHTHMIVAGIAKIGAGILLPHPENTIFGNAVDVGPKEWGNYFGWRNGWWQVGGWTAGVEYGFQLNLSRLFYLEFTDKEAYNRVSDIQVYSGRADQEVWLNELILSVGVNF